MGLTWVDPDEVGDARLYELLDRFSAAIHRVRRACAGGHERAGFEVLERQADALERVGELLEVLTEDNNAGDVPARTGE